MLIAFEGIDGSGKSTLAEYISKSKYKNLFTFCSEANANIETQLKDVLHKEDVLKTYSFAAHRTWLYEKVCKPAIDSGKIVLWDSSINSAAAYRASAEDNKDLVDIEFVKKINDPFPKADITFVFDLPAEKAFERIKKTRKSLPYTESMLNEIRSHYLNLAENDPTYIIIDATEENQHKMDIIINAIQNKWGENFYYIDEERANTLVNLMYEDYYSNPNIIASKGNLIENQIPNGTIPGSEKHLQFLFLTALNDHGVKSKTMYDKALKIYSCNPELYDPYHVVKLDESELLEKIAKPLGARYPKNSAKYWKQACEKLLSEYDGQVYNLINSTNDANELLKRILKFNGVGPKIGAMILRAIVTLQANKDIVNVEQVLLPVDVHDTRILMRTGVLNTLVGEENYLSFIEISQKIIKEACLQQKRDWVIVDKSLWLTGSMGLLDELVQRMD